MDEPKIIKPAEEEPTISSLIAEGGEGRRTFMGYAWFLAISAIVLTVGAILYPFLSPPSPEEQAAKILVLPPGAKVARVTLGSYPEVGDVWITLSEPKGPGSRMPDIWKANGYPISPPPAMLPRALPPTRHSGLATPLSPPGLLPYSYEDGYLRKTLWYDSTKRQYHFQSKVKP